MINLSENAKKIFNDLYSLTGESVEDTFKRVAKEYATNEEEEELAYELMAEGYWRGNTPIFLNAGTNHKVFSACFVVSLQDSMESIYDVANVSRKIFQFGSGVGIPIGNLREREAFIYDGNPDNTPEGKSSGPITFMKLYDSVGETTKSGGRVRRAAILCTMPIWHPDIREFITCKEEDGRLSNMNISVGVTDKFMKALDDKVSYSLISPSNGTRKCEEDAQEIWELLSENAWKSADPGVLFMDTINKYNVLVKRFLIECPNPCVIGDTLVETKRGKIKIKDMNLKDEVYTYNLEKKSIELEKISFVGKTKENAEILELEIEEGDDILKIECTPDHKIYTKNRGYVNASELTKNDDILTSKLLQL